LPRGADTQPSLRDQAYAEIKRRINRLEYCPGAYLNEAQISRQLKIGRTPLHQALDRLMLEALIQVIPRKAVMVQTISLDQVLKSLRRVSATSLITRVPQPNSRPAKTSRACNSCLLQLPP
jgi:DNA-binding GntR family transcriptional regulator